MNLWQRIKWKIFIWKLARIGKKASKAGKKLTKQTECSHLFFYTATNGYNQPRCNLYEHDLFDLQECNKLDCCGFWLRESFKYDEVQG